MLHYFVTWLHIQMLYGVHTVHWCIYMSLFYAGVYFMNDLPIENWRYENEPITKDKILEWANEWSTFPTPDLPDGNPVPKFVRVDEKTDSGIRIRFTGTQYIFVSLNDLEMFEARLQVTKNCCKVTEAHLEHSNKIHVSYSLYPTWSGMLA